MTQAAYTATATALLVLQTQLNVPIVNGLVLANSLAVADKYVTGVYSRAVHLAHAAVEAAVEQLKQ
jgi:hypothetical protein